MSDPSKTKLCSVRLESATRTVEMALRAVEAYRQEAGDTSPDSPAGVAETSIRSALASLKVETRDPGAPHGRGKCSHCGHPNVPLAPDGRTMFHGDVKSGKGDCLGSRQLPADGGE